MNYGAVGRCARAATALARGANTSSATAIIVAAIAAAAVAVATAVGFVSDRVGREKFGNLLENVGWNMMNNLVIAILMLLLLVIIWFIRVRDSGPKNREETVILEE